MGLLLLRGLVVFVLLKQTAVFSGWFMVIAFAGAVLLLLGLMTPIVALVVGLSSLAANYSVIEMIALTTAIGLLGPGAFSIDARMFGRREVLIPKRVSKNE